MMETTTHLDWVSDVKRGRNDRDNANSCINAEQHESLYRRNYLNSGNTLSLKEKNHAMA